MTRIPPDVHLITIPHTGTHSMMSCLTNAGVRFAQHHTTDKHISWHILDSGIKCIVTLRDPMRQVISAFNRGEGVKLTDWHNLAHYSHSNICFFRVDAPEAQRSSEQERLNAFLDTSASFDWSTHANSRPDATGLHQRYSETGRLGEFFEKQISERAVQFLREHGYNLPWMEGRGHG